MKGRFSSQNLSWEISWQGGRRGTRYIAPQTDDAANSRDEAAGSSEDEAISSPEDEGAGSPEDEAASLPEDEAASPSEDEAAGSHAHMVRHVNTFCF